MYIMIACIKGVALCDAEDKKCLYESSVCYGVPFMIGTFRFDFPSIHLPILNAQFLVRAD